MSASPTAVATSARPLHGPRDSAWFWAGVVTLNLVLAFAAHALIPEHNVATSDRAGYEWIAQNGLAPDCPHTNFCYRVLVPTVLAHLPLDLPTAWSYYPVALNAAAGSVLAIVCARLVAAPRRAAIVGSLIAQTSFGFTFATFDPYTPDPAVFLVAAILALAWLSDRPWVALLAAIVGVFAKETVGLYAAALAIGSIVPPRIARWRAWVGQAAVALVVLLGFHAYMDLTAHWSVAGSPAANLLGGSWLALWLRDAGLTWPARIFYIFIPFAFVWLFGGLGLRRAPDRLVRLAIGLALPLLGLLYVQNVERALGNAFVVVIPAAVLLLERVPFPVALAAVAANGLLTARVGLSAGILPPVPALLALAAGLAAWVLWQVYAGRARADVVVPTPLVNGPTRRHLTGES